MMFAIGFLSLLSVGFVAMAMGGEDDVSDVDQTEDMQDDLAPSTQGVGLADPGANQSLDLSDFGIEVSENIAAEDLVRINAFISELEATPTEEMASLIQEFIAELEASQEEVVEEEVSEESTEQEFEDTAEDNVEADAEEAPATYEPESEEEDVRPPMGNEFRDPLKVAEELEQQRILDEFAAEEARQPENLVTVSDKEGAEIADELVLAERDDDAPETDPSFTVTAPDAANSIEVGFDSEHTFQIHHNGQTTSVTAGLNSDIEGEDVLRTRTITNEEDETGASVRTIYWTKEYGTSTDITMEVAQDHIGTHVAQIDLTNPNDDLTFDFASDVTGNLHLVYVENEEGGEGETVAVKRAFVIQTAADVSNLSSSDIADLIASESGQTEDGSVLAEIYLGEDSLLINGEPGSGEPYEVRISNFINDEATITSSIGWSSITDHDDDITDQGAEQPSGDGMGGGEEDDIAELFEDLGLNPGFFGF
ncbi:hypothetical protein [Sulfitobacter sediminilitoris]|nr:hypothetical protein [Sulfitobacter sediminilitoris]